MPVSYPSSLQTVGITTTLIANANQNRTQLILVGTDSDVYVKLGTQASLSNYTYLLYKRGTVEVSNYTGVVTAISPFQPTLVNVSEGA